MAARPRLRPNRTPADHAAAAARMDGWWDRTADAPVATLHVGDGIRNAPPAPSGEGPEGWRRAWLDLDARIADAERRWDAGADYAESIPALDPNLGPDVFATRFGLALEYGDGTSWGRPVAESAVAAPAGPVAGAPDWDRAMAYLDRSIAASRGRWATLVPDLHANLDLVSALLGPEAACLALIDEPEAVHRLRAAADRELAAGLQRCFDAIGAAGLPYGNWMRAFSARPVHIVQCDFAALISPAQFREFVLPSLRFEVGLAPRTVFHLDGPDALRHLDDVLALDGLDAVQWVYGAGHGRARDWTDVYRRILAAGKGVKVECADGDDVRALAPILGGRGVWYGVGASDEAEAADLLHAMGR